MYPLPQTADYIVLSMINPHLGHVHWHITKGSEDSLMQRNGSKARFVVRIYDVTDIIFDGSNSHFFFDLDVGGSEGSYYFGIDRLPRNYLAEIGIQSGNVRHVFARSNSVFFDRDRRSGNYQVAGLFVGGALNRVFAVENIFDAPVYEKMNGELAGIEREEALSIAVVFLCIEGISSLESPLRVLIETVSERFTKFRGRAQLFSSHTGVSIDYADEFLLDRIHSLSEKIVDDLASVHKKNPFHLIHCHDWYSTVIALAAAREFHLPMILSLHSTEHERSHGNRRDPLSTAICSWEERAVQSAELLIVPHSSTRQQVVNLYNARPEKVFIIPDVLTEGPSSVPADSSDAKRRFGLNTEAPVVLFAGEISHASGADLLVDALPTVCRNHRTAQFVFAGDGPLKAELESRVRRTAVGHRCRFFGDVPRETFEVLLAASDFVVIPARVWQDEGLAQMAIGAGKPVLTTRQAGINCVVHGETGLVTFDNPGSIVWGIQELLFNPLQGVIRLAAKKNASKSPSMENIAAQLYMHYEIVLKNFQGAKNA